MWCNCVSPVNKALKDFAQHFGVGPHKQIAHPLYKSGATRLDIKLVFAPLCSGLNNIWKITMQLLQLLNTALHLAAFVYTVGLTFSFVTGLPKPTPTKTENTFSHPSSPKNSHEDALEPPQNQLQV